LEREVVDWLKEQGTRLLGLDLPSVDQLDSKDLPIHHALGNADITIVEGLWLEGVPEGQYEFFAAPIKFIGTDGALLRAVIRAME
jgi:arylformamidase